MTHRILRGRVSRFFLCFLLSLTAIPLYVLVNGVITRYLVDTYFRVRAAYYILAIPLIHVLAYFPWASLLLAVIVYAYVNHEINLRRGFKTFLLSFKPAFIVLLAFTVIYVSLVSGLGYYYELSEQRLKALLLASMGFDVFHAIWLIVYPPLTAAAAICVVEGGGLRRALKIVKREVVWLLLSTVLAGIVSLIAFTVATSAIIALDPLLHLSNPLIPLPSGIRNPRELKVIADYTPSIGMAIAVPFKFFVYAVTYGELAYLVLRER